jgi:hypothetical protein
MTQIEAAMLDMATFLDDRGLPCEPLVRQLALGLERPEIVASFSKALAKAEGRRDG